MRQSLIVKLLASRYKPLEFLRIMRRSCQVLDLPLYDKLLAHEFSKLSGIILLGQYYAGVKLEREILGFVIERNNLLEEIIRLNHLAISEFSYLDEVDRKHFLLTRVYMIEALVLCENKIIAYSMMDWTTFTFDSAYKTEYMMLCREKDELIVSIINQDRVIGKLMGDKQGALEKTA